MHFSPIQFRYHSYILLLLQLALKIGSNSSENVVAENLKRLRGNLLKNYDKTMRPSKNYLIPTSVKLLFDVQNVVELDEKKQVLTVKGILMMTWSDEHLVWNPDDYGGIKMIRLANHEVWRPDIYSLYSVKENHMYGEQSPTLMLVSSSGAIKWYPSAVFDVPCSARFRHYPFDEHNCTLLFGSWTHLGEDIALEAFSQPVRAMEATTPPQWLLTDVRHESHIHRIGENMTYHSVSVRLDLRRTGSLHKYVCLVPVVVGVVTTLSGFWLRASEPSRYLVGCANVLVMSFLLQHLALTIPAGNQVPLIAEYSAASLCISGAFLLLSISVALIGQSSNAPPTTFVRWARQSAGSILCLSTFTSGPEVPDGSRTEMTSFDDLQRGQDWALLALVVDRLAFWVFVIVYVLLISVLAAI